MPGLFPEEEELPEPPAEGPGLFGAALSAAPVAAPAPSAPAAPPAAAYRVLARTYRPTRFDDLIGQQAMVRTLRNAFALGRIAHAFMLTGVRGVGKTTTARIIARALNCVGPDGTGGPTADPCGVCANCVAILADRHPDVMEMDAASRTGVDDVREIIEATRFRPLQARTKLFIIDEVHMLSRNAFNALLKTLEEPPPHVKFIFATTEIRKVPVTVLSRCQRFDLRRVSRAELAGLFARVASAEQVAITEGALDLIARAADGSVRDGLSLLDQAIAQGADDGPIDAKQIIEMLGLADRGQVFDLAQAVLGGDTAAALAITELAHERGTDAGLLLGDLLALVHVLTRLAAVPALAESADLPEAERDRGAALAAQAGVPVLARVWQMLVKGLAEVETAPDRRAAAEMVLIRLCHAADLPPPGELLRLLSADPTAGLRPAAPAPVPAPGGGAHAAMGGGALPALAASPQPSAIPAQAEPAFAPRSFRDVIALAADRSDPMLHAHLLHSAHLVRFAPPVIELRPEPDAPRDLAARLAALLAEVTGTRWTIALSTAPGQPTLAEQGQSADAQRRRAALAHPLVLAIMQAFPDAQLESVHDRGSDRYGLPAVTELLPEAPPPPDDESAYYEDGPDENDDA